MQMTLTRCDGLQWLCALGYPTGNAWKQNQVSEHISHTSWFLIQNMDLFALVSGSIIFRFICTLILKVLFIENKFPRSWFKVSDDWLRFTDRTPQSEY